MSCLHASPPLDPGVGLGHAPQSGTLPAENGNLGRWFVWLTPLAAGISCLPDLEIGGLRYTGWLWMILLVLAAGLYL